MSWKLGNIIRLITQIGLQPWH